MAGTPAKATSAPAAAPKADDEALTPGEVSDSRDSSPRAKADTAGKRVRAIPAIITKKQDRSTTVEVRRSDFKAVGIDHPTVVWDFRKDNFTVRVGSKPGQLSQEAAEYLTENHPTSFEYINE